MKIIDLFAGVGGIALGCGDLGEVVFSNDFCKFAKDTYDLNHNCKITLADIDDIPIKDIPNFDLLVAGFPCQPFSIAGRTEGFDDDRGNAFFSIYDIVSVRKPAVVFLENVKNLASHDGGRTLTVILSSLADLGYHINYKVLNAKNFGLAQTRERIYIVAFLDKKAADAFKFPVGCGCKMPLSSFLEQDVDQKHYYEGKPLYEKIKDQIEPGGVYQWRRQYVRRNAQNLCPTLTANMGGGGHNVPIIHDGKGIRRLTPRECFSLQGFPLDFKLPQLSDARLYQQAGNSVAVPVIRAIAQSIASALS